MICENLLIVKGKNEIDILEFLNKNYENISIRETNRDNDEHSSFKFETDKLLDKDFLLNLSADHPTILFIFSYFYHKGNHYKIGYFSALNGKLKKERSWDSKRKENSSLGFHYAFNFANRFYPLLVDEIFT